jgi:WD40 repeat protein
VDSPDVTLLMDDQQQRWQRGERVLVESYLARYPALAAAPGDLLDLIYHEVVLREESGDSPRLEEYQRRFPALQEKLSRQFEVHLALASGRHSAAGETSVGGTVRASGPPPADLPSLPGYEVLERLGHGGAGVVYRARQTALGRDVALKLLRDWPGADAKDLERVLEEARALARLKHPHVVQIHAVEEYRPADGGRPVPLLCLEYVEGGNLAGRLRGQPLPARTAAALVETLARAAAYLHERGLIHCDLKPANVLLDPSGEHAAGLGVPKIADFGFARLTGPDAAGRGDTIGGTAGYMAPEQAAGKTAEISTATDVYALGAILYECLTGRPPFLGATRKEVLDQVVSCEPVPPQRLQPGVPRDLETICLKCLQKQPAKRYATAQALADDLRRFQNGEPIIARPVGPAERLWLWCWRHPTVSLLAAVLLLVVAGSLTAITAKVREVWHERDELDTANRELEAQLYVTRVLLAYRAWLDADLVKVNQLLDACPPGLRRLEWYALRRRSQGPRLSIPTRGRPVDLAAGKVLRRFPGDLSVQALARNADGSRLAVVVEGEQKLMVWDAAGMKCHWSRPSAEVGRHVHDLRFVDGGAAVLTVGEGPDPGGSGTTVLEFQRWDSRTGKRLTTVTTPPLAGRTHVGLSPDGSLLAWMTPFDAGGVALATPIYDTTTGQVLWWLGDQKPIRCVAFSRDNRLIAASGGAVKLWHALTRKEICTLGETACGAYALEFSPDGQTLVTVGRENDIRLWKAGEPAAGVLRFPDNLGAPLGVLGRSAGPIRELAYNGEQLVTLRTDGVLEVWDLRDRGLTSVDEVMDYPASIAFRPDGADLRISLGRRTLLPRGATPTVVVTGRRDGSPWSIGGDPQGVLLSLDARLLAVVGPDGTRVWELDSRKVLFSTPGLTAVGFTADGSLLGVLGDGKSAVLAVVENTTGKERHRLEGPPGAVGGTTVSADGRLAAVAYEDRSVLVWDLTTGKRVHSFRVPGGDRFALLALRSDGRRLVLLERAAVVRDAANGQLRFALTGQGSPITCAAYSPDGLRLLTGSADGSVKLWDAGSGQEFLSFQDRRLPVRWVTFSPDGRRFAAGCGGGILAPSTTNPAAFLIWDARPPDQEGKE